MKRKEELFLFFGGAECPLRTANQFVSEILSRSGYKIMKKTSSKATKKWSLHIQQRDTNTMSGGDDLESDDEYLDQNWHENEEVAVQIDDFKETRKESELKRSAEEIGDPDKEVEPKKQKKEKSPRALLLEAGRGIAESGPEEQAFFLWTAYCHALKLKGEEIESDDKFTPENFVEPKMEATKYEKSMVKYLKSGVLSSMKRMKKWKVEKSPMVIIVCSSALRAVAVLKEISSLNLRVAKLFAKHMNVDDQVNMLASNSYPIGVGTPNRLLKLIQTDGEDERSALSLDFTELVLIDCQEDKKNFTVCTMNDTAPDMMKLIKEGVLPQMKTRKTIKFGMF